MLSAAIVCPDQRVVLPLAPEPILKTDGSQKNDCEHNAAKRFLMDFKREHPYLKVIITGDDLYPDGPFIKRLQQDDQRSYFFQFFINSLEDLWAALAYGHQGTALPFNTRLSSQLFQSVLRGCFARSSTIALQLDENSFAGSR